MASKVAHDNVQSILDGVTKDPETGVPGLVFVAIDKNGDYITENASGHRGLGSKKPMDMDTVFWIASCTKVLATIACMQAVEQGKLKLDDSKHLYEYCPELEKVQVLQDDGTLVDKKNDITLRMLLTHTAGFGYEFFSAKLRDHGRPTGFDVFRGTEDEILKQPLVNQPGERWEYGINIDWAGLYLERATKTRLNDHIKSHILDPCGVSNINMFPDAHMQSNLAHMNQRHPPSDSTKAIERDHLYSRALTTPSHEISSLLHSGGAGLFAQPKQYVSVLSALLNNGTHPKTNKKILEKKTVDEMFTNQIPQFPDFARQGVPSANPLLANPAPELYPQEGNPPQGWGLSFMVTIEKGATGRGANTGWWAGIANLFYWVDRERGVAGMIASQVLPFGDAAVMGAWGQAEYAVYAALDGEGKKGGEGKGLEEGELHGAR